MIRPSESDGQKEWAGASEITMKLKAEISEQLWKNVEDPYQAGNYTHAIIEAVHFLSDQIREKASLDGDGTALVGEAFGGQDPTLRINKLQTESERNEQKGLLQLLLGIYTGIRNPRSHESIEDDKKTADAVIHFIDYVISRIGAADQPFTVEKFMRKVMDSDFVPSDRYGSLLAEEVPPKKRLDVLIEVWRSRAKGESKNVAYVSHALIERLTDAEKDEFMRVVSDDLAYASTFQQIKSSFQLLRPEMWSQLREAPRMRVENRIKKDIKVGKYDYSAGQTIDGDGALATWARSYFEHFQGAYSLAVSLVDKLSGDEEDRAYVLNFYLTILPELLEDEWWTAKAVEAICRGASEGEVAAQELLKDSFWSLPDNWRSQIRAKLEELSEDGSTILDDVDEIPF